MFEYEDKNKKGKKNISQRKQHTGLNNTGIPSSVKEKCENISGMSFDDVRVHYNSDKPAQLQALAYTQGSNVYVGPGQERHLGHELAHVIQQKQGRVNVTDHFGGQPLNTDERLEREADDIGNRIMQMKTDIIQFDKKYYWCQTSTHSTWQYVGAFGNHAEANEWLKKNKQKYNIIKFAQGVSKKKFK